MHCFTGLNQHENARRGYYNEDNTTEDAEDMGLGVSNDCTQAWMALQGLKGEHREQSTWVGGAHQPQGLQLWEHLINPLIVL